MALGTTNEKERNNMNKKLLLMLLVITSCQLKRDNSLNNVLENVIIDSNTVSQDVEPLGCDLVDTLSIVGDFEYQLRKINQREYQINWGDKNYKRKYHETFGCWQSTDKEICDFTPKVDTMTDNEIILRVTTSTPSVSNCSPIEYKMIYLPNNKKEEPFEIEFYQKTIGRYVIFSNSLDTISVMNLETKKIQSMELNPKPYFEFKTIDSSLDGIRIDGKVLKFRYFIGTHEQYNYTDRRMSLKI
ncbi:MAG: hypothetical protein KA275_09505 [Chitinophagaceae bacterium]|nr:hypothetical protein [Chitinophagaceae bacterium]